MPTTDSASASRRLLALLSLLQARRDWPAHALADRLGVSERTVRRDIDRLRALEYVVEATRGPDGGYRLAAGERMPPLLLDDEQAVAVALALRAAPAIGANLGEAAERALATLARLLPARLGARLSALDVAAAAPAPALDSTDADPEVLALVGAAIAAREELRFEYRSPRGAPAADPAEGPRRVEPHHLVLHGGRWYLVAVDPGREGPGGWRILRVDRIVPRSHTGRRFVPRAVPGGDAVRFVAARFKGSEEVDAWPCRGEAVVAAPLRRVAPFVGDGDAEEVAPDRTRVRIGAWSWAAVAASLARFDAELGAVEPRELRDAFAALAERAGRAAVNPFPGGTSRA